MKLYASLLAALIAFPAFAQTETPESPDDSMIELSNRTGSVFFSDESMMTMRSSEEIQGQWSTLSVDDQAAIRARCEELKTAAGIETTTGGETTMQNDTTATNMAYMSDDARMAPICDMISAY